MKNMTWKQQWLAVIVAAGCLCLHTVPVAAQEGSTNAPAATQDSSATNATNGTVSTGSTSYVSDGRGQDHGPIVMIGGNAELKAGEKADAVVAIGGKAIARGNVRDAVVAIFGSALAEGDVGDAVVAVMGSSKAKGRVGDAVVAVLGSAEAEGSVGDAVVAVLGNVRIGSNAVVHGDAVSVGGRVEVAEGGKVDGQIVQVGTGAFPKLPPLEGLGDWFTHCVLKFRLLSTEVGWIWWIVGAYLLLYLLITLALPKAVAACVDEMTRRPATTLLMGLLTKLLAPLVILVLTATGIGLVVVPFIMIALKIAGLIGKAAVFVYLGRQIFRGFGSDSLVHPLLALLVGFFLVTLTYLVPILSLMVFAVTGLWAIGAAVTAAFGGLRKEMPQRPPSPPPPASTGGTPGMVAPVANLSSAGNPAATGPVNQATLPPIQTNVPEAFALQRASFWERMAAGFLDIVLVGLLSAIVGGMPLGLLVALAYFAGMWAWKGTTIGGIVLNLKVVRCDGQPVSFAVALVRALAAAFSVVVLFLGFIWIAFDREKQGWHDKIAGTVVVRQPRGMPLVVL